MKNRENILIVKEFYRALSHGDPAQARSVLAPEIEWSEPSEEGLAFGGTHHGTEGVFKEVINVIHDKIRDFQIKPIKFLGVGDMVFVLGRSTGRGRVTDLKLDAPTAHIWTLRNGKAVNFEAFHDVPAWRTALRFGVVEEEEPLPGWEANAKG